VTIFLNLLMGLILTMTAFILNIFPGTRDVQKVSR
jgi:hypothetical protein